jgi:signal-transduction protein with cAMP-binding, CBS, and nucleotidyltransferase domain
MMDNPECSILLTMPLFKGLSVEDIEFIKDKVSFVTYDKDEIILNGSQFEDKNCYFIISGCVRVIKSSAINIEVSYYDLEYPMGFGFENSFLETINYNNNNNMIVSAADISVICSIKQHHFEDLLLDTRLLKNFTQYLIMVQNHLTNPPKTLMNKFRKTA